MEDFPFRISPETEVILRKQNDYDNNRRWAHRIRSYWIKRGYHGIRAEVMQEYQKAKDQYGDVHVMFVWTIKTNMVGGYPPKELQASLAA